MTNLDWFTNIPDDYDHEYEYPEYDEPYRECEECGHPMNLIIDRHYGADRDGNRGVCMEWWECPDCG